MSKLSTVLVATLVAGSVALTAPAVAKPKPPRADLVTKSVGASVFGGNVVAAATVKNKGSKKAHASTATFYLSADRRHSGDDKTLGTTPVGPIKPKKAKPVGGTFPLPAGLAGGSYYVIACADSGSSVKERKETDNCKGSSTAVQLVVKQVTVSWTNDAPAFGSVSAKATNGTCTTADVITGAGSCTVDSGVGTVVLTATTIFTFDGFSGATCDGVKDTAAKTVTFTAPTSDKACVASFIP